MQKLAILPAARGEYAASQCHSNASDLNDTL
jgi:hypothetical protein